MIKVGITGLGLIGASILKGLSQNEDYEIFCHSFSSVEKALEYTKNASSDINIIKNCDIIFVCSKASKTLETLEKLNSVLNKKTYVTDTTSIKSGLLGKKFNFDFVLSHPMAGSEKSGFEASRADLFQDCRWLIEKENKLLKKIIKDLGAKPFKINMSQHDKMCAQISHLPAILAFLMFDCADSESLKIASSGFRDATRLAMTNEDLAFAMFEQNRENILQAFDNLREKLNSLKKMPDDEKINLFVQIAKKRAKMYDKNGKNILKI